MASALGHFGGGGLTHDGKHHGHSSWGQKAISLGSHVGFGLWTKNVPNGFFGISLLKPDVLATIGGALVFIAVSVFGKKENGKKTAKHTSSAVMMGGAHAIAGRWVYQTHYFMHTSGNPGEPPTFSSEPQGRKVVDATTV